MVTIEISAEIFKVLEISDKNMEFTVNMEFKQTWNDTRLSFTDGIVKEIGVGSEFAKNFWIPDTIFYNEKRKSIPENLNDSQMFLKIQSSGAITLSRRLQVTPTCLMDLHMYPLDSQICSLEIQSSGHSVEDIQHAWVDGNNSVWLVSPDMPHNNFRILGVVLGEKEVEQMSGIYKRLVVNIKMSRRWGYFVKTFYIPASASVFLSWLALTIPPKHATARVVLTTGMLCTTGMLHRQVSGMTAPVPYLTAADIFGGGCYLLIVWSLVVSVVAISVGSNNTRRKEEKLLQSAVKCLLGRWADLLGLLTLPLLIGVLGRKYWDMFQLDILLAEL